MHTEALLCAKHCAKAVNRDKHLLAAGLAYNLVQREKVRRTMSGCGKSSEGTQRGEELVTWDDAKIHINGMTKEVLSDEE